MWTFPSSFCIDGHFLGRYTNFWLDVGSIVGAAQKS